MTYKAMENVELVFENKYLENRNNLMKSINDHNLLKKYKQKNPSKTFCQKS